MFDINCLREILSSGDGEIIKWCQGVGLIRRERSCEVCGGEAKICVRKAGSGNSRWRCVKTKDRHDWQETITRNTIFEDSKFGISRLLLFFYHFAHGMTKYSELERETSTSGETTSKATINQWLVYCRKVCFVWLDRKCSVEELIGGPGRVVRIDETKIEKRKRSRGRRVEDQWVVGMIEVHDYYAEVSSRINNDSDTTTAGAGRFRIEICPQSVHDKSTLISLIKKHVREGSLIVTDCWRDSVDLESHGYKYIKPEPNIGNTKEPESQWCSLKKEVRRGGMKEENLVDHLYEFVWRNEMDRLKKDRFLGFIECAITVYDLY